MTPAEVIDHALARGLVSENGHPVDLRALPGLSTAEIERFEVTLPAPLPSAVLDLLRKYRGLDGLLEGIDFTGESMDFELSDVFPYGLPFAADGFGNFWVLDLVPESAEWGPVYFASHDPPVILYQNANLTEYLVELFRMFEPPFKSLVDDVHEDRLFDVWGRNPGVISYEEARSIDDGVIHDFLSDLDETWSMIDLRNARPGQGFSWGRYGPNTEVRRYRHEPIFAYKKPPKKRFLGLFG